MKKNIKKRKRSIKIKNKDVFLISAILWTTLSILFKTDFNPIIKGILLVVSLELLIFSYSLYLYLVPKYYMFNTWFADLSSLEHAVFTPKFKLPKDRDLFQKSVGNSCSETILPELNMNEYNFLNTNIRGCYFQPNSVISDDYNFFQKVHNKNIQGVTLPIGDFSNFNFKGVNFNYIIFRDNSKIPTDPNFFQYYPYKNTTLRLRIPKECGKIIHYYNFNDLDFEFIEKIKVTTEQIAILGRTISPELLSKNFIVA